VVQSGKDRLRELLDELIWFPSNDPLVDSEHHHVHPVDSGRLTQPFPFEGTIKKIIQKAVETQRENGSFPLCFAEGSLQWLVNDKLVSSPIWLTPLTITRDRLKQAVSFHSDPEESFLNPFIPLHLKRQFELEFSEEDIDKLTCIDWLKVHGFENATSSFSAIGNFHHHRFALVKELETVLTLPNSSIVSQLLGEEPHEKINDGFVSYPLYPLDNDQMKAVQLAGEKNLVIQGPPGTGKSHVLTTLLANVLANGKNALVVSEKRVALEVLQKKLAQFGLDHYAFIASSTTISTDFIAELKASWQQLENKSSGSLPAQLRLSEQHIDQLQLQLDLVNTSGIAGGVDYSAFKALEPKGLEKVEYFTQLPDLSDWLRWEHLVRELYDRAMTTSVSRIKRTLLASTTFFKLDVLVRQWKEEWSALNQQFDIRTWKDLQRAMKKAAVCHVLNQPSFKTFEPLLISGSAAHKKLKRLQSSYSKAVQYEAQAKTQCIHWKTIPSELECTFLLEQSAHSGFWKKIQFKKTWSTFADIPVNFASAALKNQLIWLNATRDKEAVRMKLQELGIVHPEVDLPEIEHLERALSSSDWSLWQGLTEKEKHDFSDNNQQLNGLYSSLYNHLQLDDTTELEPVLNHLLVHFPTMMHFREELLLLPENLAVNLLLFNSAEELFAAIYKRTFVRLSNQFPQLTDFSAHGLIEKCRRIHQLQEEEGELLAEHIHARQLARFNRYSLLLTAATNKLNSEEKELKKRLKNGKSILVKVFAKSRNLPTIRELLASDARLWIDVLKPLWLSNPTQVASNIPLESGCFSLTLIDEASQLPLSDAIGCLYRSTHVVIAGDSQQMGPSAFFRKSNEQLDVLHQASFYWSSVYLTHHYRSEDPRLIAFSNRYFYNNELLAFPTARANRHPIELNYCPEGRYVDRENEVEAKEVAKRITSALNEKKSIGVVAFSATQLAAIERQLSASALNQLEELIENGNGFFKPLEHVQGEECDELIVSLGYGKNEEGEFHLRFGPLNQANGHKRLNVLFTRAKKSIVLFTSVRSSDFKFTDNESVQLLKNYVFMAEQENAITETKLSIPFGLQPHQEDTELRFNHIYTDVPNAQEMVTLVNVMEQRGWQLRF
jgi:hypothetical protein